VAQNSTEIWLSVSLESTASLLGDGLFVITLGHQLLDASQ
jgi:hypothetical protein